jgi:hypothetical protein
VVGRFASRYFQNSQTYEENEPCLTFNVGKLCYVLGIVVAVVVGYHLTVPYSVPLHVLGGSGKPQCDTAINATPCALLNNQSDQICFGAATMMFAGNVYPPGTMKNAIIVSTEMFDACTHPGCSATYPIEDFRFAPTDCVVQPAG